MAGRPPAPPLSSFPPLSSSAPLFQRLLEDTREASAPLFQRLLEDAREASAPDLRDAVASARAASASRPLLAPPPTPAAAAATQGAGAAGVTAAAALGAGVGGAGAAAAAPAGAWPPRLPSWPTRVLVLSPSRRPCSPLLLPCSRRSGPRPLHPASSRPGLGGGTRPHWRSPSAPWANAAGQHRVDRRLGCLLPHHPHMPVSSLLSDPHTPLVLLPS